MLKTKLTVLFPLCCLLQKYSVFISCLSPSLTLCPILLSQLQSSWHLATMAHQAIKHVIILENAAIFHHFLRLHLMSLLWVGQRYAMFCLLSAQHIGVCVYDRLVLSVLVSSCANQYFMYRHCLLQIVVRSLFHFVSNRVLRVAQPKRHVKVTKEV